MRKWNKKGFEVYPTIIVWGIALVMIGIVLALSLSNINSGSETQKESVPDLPYQFPAVFVHSFLEMPLEQEDLERVDMEQAVVKDIITRSDSISKKIVQEYRDKFLQEYGAGTDSLTSYLAFNDNQQFTDSDLLTIIYDASLPNLEDTIVGTGYKAIRYNGPRYQSVPETYRLEGDNYFFYYKMEQQGFVIISFYNETQNWCREYEVGCGGSS